MLEIDGLTVGYGAADVLAKLDLRIERGEVAALLGPSGCGKSTVLRCIAGFESPRAGSVKLDGRVLCDTEREHVPAETRGVGLVFQDYALFPSLTVRENLGFGLHGKGKEERIRELLAATGLEPLADRLPGRLSGGQQQRVALARAMAPRPKLLLLDEPFANVDVALKETLADCLRADLDREGLAALLVTHDRADALSLADRIGVLEGGEGPSMLVQYDTPETVYRCPATASAALQLGPAAIVRGRADGNLAATEIGELRLVQARRGDVHIVVRPESLRFVAAEGGPVRVASRSYHGTTYRLGCVVGGELIGVDETTERPDAPGDAGRLEQLRPLWALP